MGGVENLLNLPTDSTKKTADGRGVGVKNREKFADVLNGWSLSGRACSAGAKEWVSQMSYLNFERYINL